MQTQVQYQGAPKETLYIKNLNDKVPLDDLKHAIYFLFMQYGEILEIIAKKTLRGQAFVIYRDITAATNAKSVLQGFDMFDKKIDIQFAKNRSDRLQQLENNFIPRKKRRNQQTKNMENGQQHDLQNNQSNLRIIDNQPLQFQLNPVNSILHLENLPSGISDMDGMLKQLFGQYPGFVEARSIPSRNMAFIEYESDEQAEVAVTGLQGFQLSQEHYLKIDYAKKQ